MNIDKKDFRNKHIRKYITDKEKNGDNDYSELQEFLYSLLTIFTASTTGVHLYELLQQDWNIFMSVDACKKVIEEVIQSDAGNFAKDGIKNGASLVVYKKNITDCIEAWKTLKEDVKYHHRFTTDINKLNAAGWKTLLDNRYELNSGKSFYRARIHYKKTDVFGKEDMGARERGDCPQGRVNPEGIPFLYLCEEPKTTFYETRVSMHDVVSIGEFVINGSDSLYVEDLTDINLDEIEILDEDVVTLAKRKLLIRTLSNDMSRPMRRYDSPIEYVPTQFLCEYVQQTQNVSGIRFSSSIYKKGTNLVIFDPALMRCIDVKEYTVKSLDISEEVVD